MHNIYENSEVNMFDSPLEVIQLCYPDLTEREAKVKLETYQRRTYSRYVTGKTSVIPIEELEIKAIKNSHHSKLELEVLMKFNIEKDFRDEIYEMLNVTWDLIQSTSIEDMHQLIDDFETVEHAFGKRVKAQPDELSSQTLYKNNKTTGYNMYSR